MTARVPDDLWEGEMRGCELHGEKLLLVKVDGHVLVYENRCAHLGVALSEGRLERGVLTCRAHHWQYDIRTGRGVNPRSACLRARSAYVEGGEIIIELGGTP